MAKRSRRAARGEPETTRSDAAAETQPSSAVPESRARRTARARRPARQATPLERYRTLLVSGAAVVGLLIVGWLFFQSSASAAYTCATLLTPGPVESVTPRPPTPTPSATPTASPTPTAAASPASPAATAEASPSPGASPTASPSPQADPTPRLGFTTTILGRDHVRDPNQSINYGFCPPNSGEHINIQNRGPIRPGFYPSTQEQHPGGWIHNLEHGYTVALYRCSDGQCPSEAELAELRAVFEQAPTSINPACPAKVIVARFDEMDTRFALVAWGRAYLTNEFDLDTALTFAQQWTDHEAVPERGLC